MPDRPHHRDEVGPPQPPDQAPPQSGPHSGKPGEHTGVPRRTEPAKSPETGGAATGRPETGTGNVEWWKPFEQGRPRGPITPWDRAREQYKNSDNRPPPGSLADMKQQLEMLPPLDPSSPWNTDGTRRPKPPNPKDFELPLPSGLERASDGGTPSWLDMLPSGDRVMLPRQRQSERHGRGPAETGRPPAEHATQPPAEVTHDDRTTPDPLTDTEYAEHLAHVKESLEQAHASGLATNARYTVDRQKKVWAPDRAVFHEEIITELYAKAADVPSDHKAVMAGGLGGAGKSTVLEKHAGIDRSKYLTINPDDIKEVIAEKGLIPEVRGLSPMEASDLVHEESSYLAKQLAGRAIADGKNIIWDITMAGQASTQSRINDLRRAGYTTEGIFVDIPVETSVQRAEGRHRHGHEAYRNGDGNGGRYVPPGVIRENADERWGSVNRRTFEAVKPQFDGGWSLFDNSVEGRTPQLEISSSRRRESDER
jgi:predicted kinase